MIIHHYHPISLVYLGSDFADPDPLDENNWLIPAHATTLEPPEEKAGFTRNFFEGAWTYREIPAPTLIEPTYMELRAREYPPMADYLDGIVKGDQAQIDKYIADCLAVKAKYPKPE